MRDGFYAGSASRTCVSYKEVIFMPPPIIFSGTLNRFYPIVPEH